MFLTASIVLLVLTGTAAAAACTGRTEQRIAATQAASALATLLLVALSVALAEDSFIHVALVLAATSVIGGLMFARFLEHWL